MKQLQAKRGFSAMHHPSVPNRSSGSVVPQVVARPSTVMLGWQKCPMGRPALTGGASADQESRRGCKPQTATTCKAAARAGSTAINRSGGPCQGAHPVARVCGHRLCWMGSSRPPRCRHRTLGGTGRESSAAGWPAAAGSCRCQPSSSRGMRPPAQRDRVSSAEFSTPIVSVAFTGMGPRSNPSVRHLCTQWRFSGCSVCGEEGGSPGWRAHWPRKGFMAAGVIRQHALARRTRAAGLRRTFMQLKSWKPAGHVQRPVSAEHTPTCGGCGGRSEADCSLLCEC